MQILDDFYSKEFRTMEPEQVINMIKSDETLRSRTELVRSLMTKRLKEEAKRAKKQTPQVAVSFRMEGGKEKVNCRECLGRVLVDFDDKDSENLLSQEELERVFTIMRTSYHAEMGYQSISGRGYHIVVPFVLPEGVSINMVTDPALSEELFKRVHKSINRMYAVWCGHEMDEGCGNVNRMMGLSYDPLAVYRKDARPVMLTREQLGIDSDGNLIRMKSPRWAKSKQGKLTPVHLGDGLERAQQMVEESGVAFASGSHHDYVMRLSFILNRMGIDENEAADALDDAYSASMTQRPSQILRSCYRTASDEVWRVDGEALRQRHQDGGHR